jgi:hypothetical protein
MARSAYAYPEHHAGPDDLADYVPLGDALTIDWSYDAHFAAYSAPTIPRRLATVAALAAAPTMRLLIVDVDAPNHVRTSEWWHLERIKIDRLLAAHPRAYVYSSRGGYRIVFRLARAMVLHTPGDVARWSASYLGALVELKRDYAIVGDTACADWTRLYRLPRVLRDGVQQVPEVIGDPHAVGTWDLRIVEATAPTPVIREVVPGTASVPESAREMAARVLGEAWPSSGRHEAHRALAGALVTAGWSAEDVAGFAARVAEIQQPGNSDPAKRRATVSHTLACVASGAPVTGWPSLEEHVGEHAVNAARKALGMPVVEHDAGFVAAMTALAPVPAPARPGLGWTAPTTTPPVTVTPAAMADVGRPRIDIDHIHRGNTVSEAEAAIAKRGVFVRGDALVEIRRSKGGPSVCEFAEGTPRIGEIRKHRLAEILGEAAEWYAPDKTCGVKSVAPPTWVGDMLADRGQWRLPVLDGIVSSPVFRGDGSILDTPGYDARTHLLYDPMGVTFPPVPTNPTIDDARRAVAALVEPYAEFRFADPATDLAATVAIVLSLVGRGAIAGCVPMFLVDASTSGSGKGLLVDVSTMIATGREWAKRPPTNNEEEMRKRLGAIAMASPAVEIIDNVRGVFASPSFEALVTSGMFGDRVLGMSSLADAVIRTVFLMTGNNAQLNVDMVRRTVPIRIDPGVEDPAGRTFERANLRAWVRDARPRLVSAALTILRAYVEAGMPAHGNSPMGSYEGWDALVRGAIIWSMDVDPLGGVARLREDGSPERDELVNLLTAWHGAFGERPTTAKEAVTLSRAHAALKEAIAPWPAKSGEVTASSLGFALRARKDRVAGGLALRAGGKGEDGKTWRVVPCR